MSRMSVQEIYDLMEGLPPGDWVAICAEQRRILAHDEDGDKVVDEVLRLGFKGAFFGRVPSAEWPQFPTLWSV